MVQDLLHVVQGEAAEQRETTIQPDVLGKSQCPNGGGGDDKGSKTRNGDESGTREKRAADVEVLLLLGSGPDEGDSAHHSNGVEAGAGDERAGGEGDERRDESGLGGVEGGP